MNQCKILSFKCISSAEHKVKLLPDPIMKNRYVYLSDYPNIEEEIDAYLRKGYSVQKIFYEETPSADHNLFVILVK